MKNLQKEYQQVYETHFIVQYELKTKIAEPWE